MKKITLIILAALCVFISCSPKVAEKEVASNYYLIRHAEKEYSEAVDYNPDLTEQGFIRAKNWAKHFKNIKFDVIYSTNTNRTRQTATPTAKANNLELTIYEPDMNIDTFMVQNEGKTVLIVGHSNTTAMISNKLIGEEKYEEIADDNFSNLYTISIKKDSITSVLNKID